MVLEPATARTPNPSSLKPSAPHLHTLGPEAPSITVLSVLAGSWVLLNGSRVWSGYQGLGCRVPSTSSFMDTYDMGSKQGSCIQKP